MDSLSLGQKIKNFRKQAGLSQLELENKISASPGSISRIEAGKVNPTKETILRIIGVLDLSLINIIYLLDIKNEDITNYVNISKKINILDLDELLQNTVNELSTKLKIPGISVSIVKGDRIWGKTFAVNKSVNILNKIFPIPFNKMNISLIDHADNYLCKSANENKILYFEDFTLVTKHIFSDIISKAISKILCFRSGITVPLNIGKDKIGTMLFGKTYLDDFQKELPIIKAFTEQIAYAISNATKYYELQMQLEEFKNEK